MTKIVLTLSDFQLLCRTTETEILTAKEPLSVFFASCGKLYEQASDQNRTQIADHLQSALNGFEKWVPISESPPAIFKIHIVIALIIFNCSPIVYVRVGRQPFKIVSFELTVLIFSSSFFLRILVKTILLLLCDNEPLHFAIAVIDGKTAEAHFNSSCS